MPKILLDYGRDYFALLIPCDTNFLSCARIFVGKRIYRIGLLGVLVSYWDPFCFRSTSTIDESSGIRESFVQILIKILMLFLLVREKNQEPPHSYCFQTGYGIQIQKYHL